MPRKSEPIARTCPRCFTMWRTKHECMNATRHIHTATVGTGLRIEIREHRDCGGQVSLDVDGFQPGRTGE